jgi:hypothetical protein
VYMPALARNSSTSSSSSRIQQPQLPEVALAEEAPPFAEGSDFRMIGRRCRLHDYYLLCWSFRSLATGRDKGVTRA